jgi:hypothetical protein
LSVHPWYVLYLIILHQMWCGTKKLSEKKEEAKKKKPKKQKQKGGGEACKSITFSNSS